jgi:hypothetical protein
VADGTPATRTSSPRVDPRRAADPGAQIDPVERQAVAPNARAGIAIEMQIRPHVGRPAHNLLERKSARIVAIALCLFRFRHGFAPAHPRHDVDPLIRYRQPISFF